MVQQQATGFNFIILFFRQDVLKIVNMSDFKICDHSYTTGEEIVELQEVHNFSVEPATYSAVGHVQESPPMEVSGTYYSSNGVPTTYSSVVHVQVSQSIRSYICFFV